MIENFEGVVLRTLKYNDGLMIADLYTAQRGRMSFLVPVSHSKRSKVRSVLFQPLSMLSFTATVKAARSLPRISEARPFALYSSSPNDVVKTSIALFIAELLTFALREDGKDEPLFTFLDRSLMLFDNLECGYADFHLVFMVQLLHFLGIYPNIQGYAPGRYFDLAQGCVVREHPLHPDFLSHEDASSFMALLRTDYDSMHLLSLNRGLRSEYLATLSRYYQLHVPEFPELKSAAVLRELFD